MHYLFVICVDKRSEVANGAGIGCHFVPLIQNTCPFNLYGRQHLRRASAFPNKFTATSSLMVGETHGYGRTAAVGRLVHRIVNLRNALVDVGDIRCRKLFSGVDTGLVTCNPRFCGHCVVEMCLCKKAVTADGVQSHKRNDERNDRAFEHA
ncbi:MAG: hypothetical protein WA728_23170 [Xanthobacteraceae bacterium]